MRTACCVVALLASSMLAATAAAEPPNGVQLSERDHALVRQAVANVGASYERNRISNGISNVVTGVLVGGIGAYVYATQDDTMRLVGVAVAFASVPLLVSGIWDLAYPTAQEMMADKMLADRRLIDGGGVLFVEQEARRAKRSRLVGGTTSIVGGAATLGSYLLLRNVLVGGDDGTLLLFFGVAAGLQVVQGVITFATKTGAERAYDNLILGLGRDPTAHTPIRVSKLRLAPSIVSDDGKLAPAVSLSTRF